MFLIDKKFGHISHMKLLPNGCIFLCRNLFICEIYKYENNNNNTTDGENNNNFILLNMWVHNKNKEIISSNIYILGNKINTNYYNNNKIKSENTKRNEIHKNSNLNQKNKKKINKTLHNLINDDNSIDSAVSKNKILDFYKSNDEILNIKNKEINNEDNYYIITLDIDGNFNLYYNNNNIEIINTLFNIYKIKNISNNNKNLSLFSVGFPYYITMNEYYYIITTDYGIFVISKSKE